MTTMGTTMDGWRRRWMRVILMDASTTHTVVVVAHHDGPSISTHTPRLAPELDAGSHTSWVDA